MNIIVSMPAIVKESELMHFLELCNNYNLTDFRFNFAKIDNKQYVNLLLSCCEKVRRKINNANIIIDLPFPAKNIRMKLKGSKSKKVKKEEEISFCIKESEFSFDVKDDFTKYFVKGKKYYCQDGEGCFRAEEVKKDYVRFKACNDFEVKHMKAIVAEKQIEQHLGKNQIELISKIKPNVIWFSFVENATFLGEFENKISNCKVELYAKVETENGAKVLNEYIDYFDGIVFGRGDFSLNAKGKRLVTYQEYICRECKKAGKKFVVATGIVSSMANVNFPSQSELVDIEILKKYPCTSVLLNTDVAFSQNFVTALDFLCE